MVITSRRRNESHLSAFRLSQYAYILKVTANLIKEYFSLLGWYITFSLTLLSLITCDIYGDLMRVFGISKTYSFAGLPFP